MNFTEFKKVFQKNFADMVEDADTLFEVSVDKDEFWNLYLDSFPAGTNEIYRERRSHDCSCCRHFIKTVGNIVTIQNNKVRTMWDFTTGDTTYQTVINALDTYLKKRAVTDMFVTKDNSVGVDSNWELLDGGKSIKWDHFYLVIPSKFVDRTSRSIGDIQGAFRDVRNVFNRSLTEITEDAIMTVLELIASNTLYRGAEWKAVLEKFLQYKCSFDALPSEVRDNYVWEHTKEAGITVGKIRNHSIGTLLVDISNGEDLDVAVRKYEKIVAPENYKRPKAIFTKKMLEDAKKTIFDLGYMDSLSRRFATLDDISVNNILFSNKDATRRISGGDVFDEMMSETSGSAKKFTRVEEIPIEKFISDVLPTAKSVEAYLENKHAPNMVSLIAPKNPDAPTMFKWDNGFSWAYSGNITDSNVKQNVKNAGGNVDGVLRFSIQWNDGEKHNPNDFDAHCRHPNGSEICYYNKVDRNSGGNLDVDIITPRRDVVAVENIVFPDKRRMRSGTYQFYVNCYNNRGGRDGFRAEIEFDGVIHSFEYNHNLRTGENIQVADVVLDQNGNFTIVEKLPANVSSRDIWGMKTNQFIPVSVIMHSPNYWDEQQGIGNKHYMFMLKDCVNPENPNGFYNEFLKSELVQHKRVFEALGGKMAVESVDDQLSGLGFSSTKRNDLVVRVKGQTERIMRIKF